MSRFAAAMASSRSPVDMLRKREMGSVSVRKRVAPASMRAAPNSPSALAQVMTVPAMMPFFDRGRVTLKKAWAGVQPRVLEINSSRGLTDKMVDFITRITKGRLTKNWAMMMPLIVKTKGRPIFSSQAPKAVVPKKSKRQTPDTTGGRARGRSSSVLNKDLRGKSILART